MTQLMASARQIHGFEIIETLGQGARSTIYAVRDRSGQIYALKHVIKRDESDQRFLVQAIVEYEVSQRLTHPCLRRSYKLIRQRRLIRTSEVLVLMELVDGLTLEQSQIADPLTICKLCELAAAGLEAMHQGGYVHADIKPNNILMTSEDSVKIIDFGQSCKAGTVKERIQGTPDYIAPEQVLRRPITARTDIFNLGATMYWLLTRQHVPTMIPKGEPGLSIKTEQSCPTPGELNAAVPPALSSLVMKCVETAQDKRPETMSHVRDWLKIAMEQLSRKG